MHEVFDRFPTTNLAFHSDSSRKREEEENREGIGDTLRDATKISAPAVGVKRRKKAPTTTSNYSPYSDFIGRVSSIYPKGPHTLINSIHS